MAATGDVVTVVLAHTLTAATIRALTMPPGAYTVGTLVVTDKTTAYRLIQAGLTTTDPRDRVAVASVMEGAFPYDTGYQVPEADVIHGQWFVTQARLRVDLAALRAANGVVAQTLYRIVLYADGALMTHRWAVAGSQVPDTVLAAAQAAESLDPIPSEPATSLGGGGGGGADFEAIVSSLRETNGGLAGLTQAGKVYENRLPDRLSSAAMTAAAAGYRDRSTHTGVQPVTSIDGIAAYVRSLVASMIVQGTNITTFYNAGAGTLTISAVGGAGAVTPYVDPAAPALLVLTEGATGQGVYDPSDTRVLVVTTGPGKTVDPADSTVLILQTAA